MNDSHANRNGGTVPELLRQSLCEARQGLAGGRFDSTELLDAVDTHLAAQPALAAAFLRRDGEGARREAATRSLADVRHAPLAGIPLAHKDILAAAGHTSTFASHPRYHRRAQRDADAIAALARAGALNLGALHLSEFAMGPAGWSEHRGFIDNPLAPVRVSGGSSSGSAAAVAGHAVFGSLGSDTGGSIRLPAAFCGIVGLKPTHARLSLRGVQAVSPTLDTIGPLARDVADCARLFDALQGRPPHDSGSTEAALADREHARALRIGILAPAGLPMAPDDDIATLFADRTDALARAGHRLADTRIDDWHTLNTLSGIVFLSEAATVHLAHLREPDCAIGPQVRQRLLQGLAYPAPLYLEAIAARDAQRARIREQLFSRFDVLISPTAPCFPPRRTDYDALHDTADILRFNSRLGAYTGMLNYLGFPALSVPMLRDGERGGAGLQLIADDGREAALFQLAAVLEQHLPPR